jgi:hypothetical protein
VAVRTHSRWLTFVMVIAMASSTFALAVISALAADIIDEFAITREQLGLLVTAAAFTGAALAPILGPLADRLGARAATLFSLLSSAAATLAMRMASARRSRSITRPRQIAMALAKELTQHSLPEIGQAFGGRDHTTVIHAVDKTQRLMRENKVTYDQVTGIITQLKSS